jgi:hypothetical protein
MAEPDIARLRNALSTLTTEECEAMVYGMDHPQEFGAECVTIGGFIRKNRRGEGYCFCPVALMLLRLGQARVVDDYDYMRLDWHNNAPSASKVHVLWPAIDGYIDDDRSSSDQSRIDETVAAIKRVCAELATT